MLLAQIFRTLSLSLSPFIPFIHRSRQVFQTTSYIHTEPLYVSSCWLANTGSFVLRDPLENVTYEFVLASPEVSCLVRLIWMVLEIGGKWPYNCCFVGCFFQDLFNIGRSIFVQFRQVFFSFFIRFVSVYVVHPYSRIDTTAAWKKLHFILLDRSDFHMIDNLSIAAHTFARRILMSLSVDEMILPRKKQISSSSKISASFIYIYQSFLLFQCCGVQS